MSLINCPECGHEVAATAVACPNCGHPFVKPVVHTATPPRVIVQEVVEENEFPKWVFIPLGLLGLVILFVLFAMFRNKDDDQSQRNINVNLTTRGQTTTTVPSTSAPSTMTVPSTSAPSTVTVPQNVPQTSVPTTVTSLPPASTTTTVTAPAPPPDKGNVVMEAKVMNRGSSAPQPVGRVKFYLLDKDLDSILADANINDETGQGLVNAYGLAITDPGKYRDTFQKATAAINRHVVYSTSTDGGGKAQLKGVKPKGYYLFGITKTRNGFALWNAPISINPGENSLILDPVTPTEIVESPQ